MLSSISPTARQWESTAPSLQTHVLSAADVQEIVRRVGLNELMDEMIAQLTSALRTYDPNQTVIPVRTGFSYSRPHTGLVEWMPLFQKQEQIMVKAVGYHPHNPQRYHLPTVLSTLSAYDPATGHLTAMMDGTFMTALRTGAASAIASQYLAMPESSTLGLIGLGAQAVTQLHALSRRFALSQVLIFDVEATAVHSFAERVRCLDLGDIEIHSAPLPAVSARSDILCTATSVPVHKGPVFADKDIQPWLHVNAVGADFPGKFEVPMSLLERSFICPDFREQALQEGECQRLENVDEMGSELHEVVQNPERYLGYQHQSTVFDSTGFALEDQVAMNLLLDYATDLQMGTYVALESAYADVKNPYSFMTETGTADAPAAFKELEASL